MRATLTLILSLLLAFTAAAFGASFPPDAWYDGLAKPPWNPPGWLFGPVWTVLYAGMAIAAWRVWQRRADQPVGPALGLYLGQLVLNGAWSWLFFGLHRPAWALIEILCLWVAIVATMIAFFRRDRIAGWLLVPYLAWVSFASVLNYTLWQLN